ncbi:MAG: DnaD domain protein [Halanaerobiales bacterium]
MNDDLFINQQQKTSISTNKCRRSIEIGECAIDQGFLLQFPGATLSIFLYLITHANERDIIETNPTIISSYIPDTYDITDIKDGLKFMEKHDIIEFSRKRGGDYTYQIKIKLHKLSKKLGSQNKSNPENDYSEDYKENYGVDFEDSKQLNNTDISSYEHNNNHIYYDQRDVRENILNIKQPSRPELFQAILTFVPPSENIGILENNINQWLEDFDSDMIKELIRRVNKWMDKYNNPPEKAFSYLKGIIDDWYQKELKGYEDLKYNDKLHREIREIAGIYGFDQWHNIKPVHMETFNKWLNDDFPLSFQVVKLAINQAIRRKKDGQPSLKYIEDNFIIPMKKQKVRNCDQAMNLLKKNDGNKYNQSYTKKASSSVKKAGNRKKADWDDLIWDFEK